MSYLDENKVSFDSTLLSNFKAEELEVLLEKHPSIEKVEVFANQKGNVAITVEQKKAVVRIKSIYDDYYLDEFGKRMKLSSTYTPNLLVVTGEVRVSNHQEIFDFSDANFFKQIAELGERYSKNTELKKMNGNRGSKHFIYINRTFFGLYNLMFDLKATEVHINNFKNL